MAPVGLLLLGGVLAAYLIFEAYRRRSRQGQEGAGEPEEEWDEVYRDTSPSALPWETGEPAEGLVEVLESGRVEKGRALDLGSGLGTQSLYLARMGFRVSGIDISPTAVEVANRRADLEGLDCYFIQGDVLELPYPDGSFSFVLDRGCFHHIPEDDRESYVRGVARVMKRGGMLYLECFSHRNGPGWNHFTPGQIEGYFSPHFRILSISDRTFTEPSTGHILHFLRVLMEKG
ncbi:MAG: methyltransferase domain-containing protein [Euryarchaeota archaeon]|nr:methyltransferase domain-containing protein [Euryarchaeota archaeon]